MIPSRLLFLGVLLLSVACKKSAGPPKPSFQFKANGVEYVLDGKGAYYDIGLDGPRGCHIYGSNGIVSAAPSFVATFTTDSVLQQKTYYTAGDWVNLGASCMLPGFNFRFDNNSSDTTNVTLTITEILDSTASGTFSAHLDPGLTVTEGIFQHIRIVKYQ